MKGVPAVALAVRAEVMTAGPSTVSCRVSTALPTVQDTRFAAYVLQLDAWLRYTGKLDSVPTLSPLGVTSVDPYFSLTLRLGWKPRSDLELALVGANLLGSPHLEFAQEAFPYPVEIERSVYGQVKWSF